MWVCGEGGWERREEQEGGVRSERRNSDKERRGVLVAREARIREVGTGELLQLLCVHCGLLFQLHHRRSGSVAQHHPKGTGGR